MLAVIWLPLAVIFETPLAAALVAGGAVSIPIIIHLLNRRRFKVVHWAAMRFLLAAQRKNSQRMRLEQLILLMVRCLILLLLLTAMLSVTPWAEGFWRWCLPNAAVAMSGSSRTHKILVIDGSFSMGAKAVEGTAFDRARSLAAQLVRESPRGDGFSVLLLSSPPRRIIPEPSEDGVKVAHEIESLRLPHGNADLSAAFSSIESLLQSSPGKFPDKEIYFFTDLQKSTWLGTGPINLSPASRRARTILVDVGSEQQGNVAVTNLSLLDDLAVAGRNSTVQATLHNYGNEAPNATARLLVGRAPSTASDPPFELREVESRPVHVERNQATTVSFVYKFPIPGDYAVQVQVQNDSLPIDDSRSVILTVKKDLSVLLVNGKPFGDPFDQSAEWLRFALNPFTGPGEGPTVVRPRMINSAQFADETLGDLTAYDCVFLCDLANFSLAEVRRLEGHVRRGGGVVFCLGSQVQAGEYNRVLFKDGTGLLPVPLVGPQSAGRVYQFQLALEADSDRLPPIRAFRGDEDRASLLAPRFTRFYQTGHPAAGVKPRRILSFNPVIIPGKEAGVSTVRVPASGPAILEWNPPSPQEQSQKTLTTLTSPRLRGKVVLVCGPVNSDWSNWPASPSFPALMNELLYFASSGRLQEQAIEVGQGLELFLPGVASADATVSTPDGRKDGANTQILDNGSILRWTDNDISGIYRVKIGQNPREHLFAVNPPTLTSSRQGSESDLTRATPEELQRVYSELELQTVQDLAAIHHTSHSEDLQEKVYQPLGSAIARWLLILVLSLILLEVLLASVFGHYASTVRTEQDRSPRSLTWPGRLLLGIPYVLLGLGLLITGVLAHEAVTGDFLGFLSEETRQNLETTVGVKTPAAGEVSHWRLEYNHYFLDDRTDPWLAGGVLAAGAALVYLVYRREGQKPASFERLVLVGLRVGTLLLLLGVLLPQLKLHFERQGWPDVVLLIDDSQSMSAIEKYGETEVREAADVLAREASRLAGDKHALARKKEELAQQKEDAGQRRTPDDPERMRLLLETSLLTEEVRQLDQEADVLDRAKDGTDLQRLHLLQALATRNDLHWLHHFIEQRRVKVHIYHCSTRAAKLAQVTTTDQLNQGAEAILGLTASPRNDSSQLGTAVRQVINDFRGSSLGALIMLTDGVTTDGEGLAAASRYAGQMGIPLYFVGVGDAHEIRNIYLHDLQAEDSVYVNDHMVFELKLTAQGYKNLTVPVVLREKGSSKDLDRQMVSFDSQGKSVKVRLTHQPTEPGEKVYVIETPVLEGEVEKDDNRLEKAVSVRQTKLIKVLYVESSRRYEFHFLKTLLERESDRVKGNKTVDLKVLLLDADPGFVRSDRSALREFPSRKELDGYDVVILGDVDPTTPGIAEHLKDLGDFVKERGGGLLMLAGEHFAPHAYRTSPLRDVLPIEMLAERAVDDPDVQRAEGYRLETTPVGRVHPIFRFTPEEKENDEIWSRLKEMFWYAEGYVPKRAAEVLAVHPKAKRADKQGKDGDSTAIDKHPLVIQHFVGSGRCMFFGFSETWRWGFREDQLRYNQFWIQTMRYLARSRLGRIDLKLDRQTHYRRGEPIKVTVRFPDDSPPPAVGTEVKVVAERKVAGKAGDRETRTLTLAPLEGTRTAFETVLTQTPEGEYAFWLSVPAVSELKPRAECKVVAPPGEMYGLRMNRSEMEAAAEESHGKFYTLTSADRLLQDLQVGNRVTVSSSGQPWLIWSTPLVFLVAVLLLTTEWLLRKRANLL